MPITFQLRDGLVEVFLNGKLTAADFEGLAESYRDAESRLEVTPDRVSDLTEADFSDLESNDLVHFAQQRKIARLKNPVKSAIIAPSPGQYGMARVFQTCNDNPFIEIRLFKDAASAYEWVGRTANVRDKVTP
jgi:hypothetical protein